MKLEKKTIRKLSWQIMLEMKIDILQKNGNPTQVTTYIIKREQKVQPTKNKRVKSHRHMSHLN